MDVLTECNFDISKASLYTIAALIRRDWKRGGKGIPPHAQPYVSAMETMGKMTDHYGSDSAYEIVGYFLSNAIGWRGETAKAVKAELRRRLK